MLIYKYQNPKELIYILSKLENIYNLKIILEKKINFGDYEFIFRIIGQSHWISVYKNTELVFHEILSCENLDGSFIQKNSFNKLKNFSYEGEKYNINIILTKNILNCYDQYIEFKFPTHKSKKDLSTKITWKVENNKIMWKTIHSYQEINVITESEYKFMKN